MPAAPGSKDGSNTAYPPLTQGRRPTRGLTARSGAGCRSAPARSACGRRLRPLRRRESSAARATRGRRRESSGCRARPRCCSLPSQTAPVGRSLPNADGRVAPRQKRRANCSRSRVAGPYLSVLIARHCVVRKRRVEEHITQRRCRQRGHAVVGAAARCCVAACSNVTATPRPSAPTRRTIVPQLDRAPAGCFAIPRGRVIVAAAEAGRRDRRWPRSGPDSAVDAN